MNPSDPLKIFWGEQLPVYLQTEAGECGLACLAMVASYHGLHTDTTSLRRHFSVSRRGITLKSLLEFSKALEMTARPLRVEIDGISGVQLPCILHWRMNHYVVLHSMSRSHAIIHDPAVGRRVVSMREFGKNFTGILVELSPTAQFRPSPPQPRIRFASLLGRTIGLKKAIFQIFLLAGVLECFAVVSPLYLQWVIDSVIVPRNADILFVLALGFLVLALVQTVVGAFRGWVVSVMSARIGFQWMGNVFTHLLRLPIDFFEKRHVGDIMSRFGSINVLQRTLTTEFVQVIVDGLLVVGTFAMMLVYSPILSAISLSSAALYLIVRMFFFRLVRGATDEQISFGAKRESHLIETLFAVRAIRLFQREEPRRLAWQNLLAEQVNAELRLNRYAIAQRAIYQFLSGVDRILAVWLGALAVISESLTIGMLLAFFAYKDQFSARLVAVIDRAFDFRMLRLHGERLADILLTPPEDTGIRNESICVVPSLKLCDVHFRYSDTDPPILKGINVEIKAGECVAITGPSGCGKTTLAKVMVGMLTPTSGEILVGGMSLRQLGLANFRDMLGVVLQDDMLLSGSVSDNICLFDPDPDQGLIEASAALAAVHDEILGLPMGYDTLIGDIGTGLSGGQQQRILLARALYKKPQILILDEATSHLDIQNEHLVNKSIRSLNLTRIIIAHRPETIAMADRVIDINFGEIVSVPK